MGHVFVFAISADWLESQNSEIHLTLSLNQGTGTSARRVMEWAGAGTQQSLNLHDQPEMGFDGVLAQLWA